MYRTIDHNDNDIFNNAKNNQYYSKIDKKNVIMDKIINTIIQSHLNKLATSASFDVRYESNVPWTHNNEFVKYDLTFMSE